ncbi:MAG TPA: heterodisulfide reductase-related iron-sulfur binding cluster, partial [Chthoniobacterales bacterium]|nr:heterodisulfide reductase-related iron-sulfur binding cluster [Chthoniobacterales bacterium]
AASEVAQHNVDLLSSQLLNNSTTQPLIVFLEPSCWSMFVDDYRELKIANAEKIAERCFLFETFVDESLARNPDALRFKEREANVVIHAHCHAKSLINPAFMAGLVERLPGHRATLLDTGCCGMAGAFGALEEKYDLSKQVAADLLRKIDNQQSDIVIASGTSCRHQIVDLSERWPKHMAELIADAIA